MTDDAPRNIDIEHGGGSHEFVCEDCKIPVFKYGDHDGLNVCGVCRFIRTVPDMPEKIRAHLRGEPDTDDVPETPEEWFQSATMRDDKNTKLS